MDIQEATAIITSVDKTLSDAKLMLEDYDTCKSEQSKMYILAAVSKMLSVFKPTHTK